MADRKLYFIEEDKPEASRTPVGGYTAADQALAFGVPPEDLVDRPTDVAVDAKGNVVTPPEGL